MSSTSSYGSDRAFLTITALLAAVSVAITIVSCRSMAAMPGMLMPGGWTMTMTWMRMPGQTWLEGAASFLGMWVVMMAAMMLPSLIPRLREHRAALRAARHTHLGRLTVLAGAGYFFVWAVIGMAVYPIGMALAEMAMRRPVLSRAVPVVTAVIVLAAIALQFTEWKARRIACCGAYDRPRGTPATAAASWRYGLRLGLDCVRCCANWTAMLLVLGVMDLGVMAVVTAGITLERLGPSAMSHLPRPLRPTFERMPTRRESW